MRRLRLDFETASCVDLKKAGAWRYAEDPTTEIISLSFRLKGEREVHVWAPEKVGSFGTGALLMQYCHMRDIMFVAHNAAFEKAIWRRIMVEIYGFPDVPNERWHCTQAACAMHVIPQDLDRSLLVLRLPFQKDKEGSALAKSLSKPNKKTGQFDRSPATLQRIYDYNISDIRGTEVLDERLGDLPDGERAVWLLDQRLNERGVRLDLDLVSAAQDVVSSASRPLLSEFAGLTGGLKPSQGQKFMSWLDSVGVRLPNLQKETLAAVLGSGEDDDETEFADDLDIDLPPVAARALHIRQLVGSASVKKLARMEACVCWDGRARGLLQYHGAGPGLWAGRLFQPQNFPRGTLRSDDPDKAPDPQIVADAILTRDPDWISATLGPPVETVVHSLRHILVPGSGRAFVSADLSGIQARTVLALSGQIDKAQLMASGKDVYCDMASAIYKRPIDKKRDPEERQIGKNSVLGLGFGMGAKKFRFKYAKEHPVEFSQNVVDVYRKEWAPCVPQLWRALEGAAVQTVHKRKPHEAFGVVYRLEDGWLTAQLPSGRKLHYFNPQPCRRAMPWDDTDIRLAWTYQAMKMGQWKTIDAFGGLLTENVVMGIQRDLMTEAMFKCEANDMPIVLNVHDEIVVEVPESRADLKALIQIMTDSPQWARQLQIPVAAEGWVGDRYHK